MVAPSKMSKAELAEQVTALQREIEQIRGAGCDEPPPEGAVLVTVPMHHMDGYATRHVDLHLSHRLAAVLRDVANGLSIARAKIDSRGAQRVVKTPQDALRWILERVDEGRVEA